MKKKLILIGACSLLLCGCGKIPKLSNGDEAVVQFKGGDKISANQLYDEIKKQNGLGVLINMINKYVYEKELPDKLAEAEDYANAYIAQAKAQYDTDESFTNFLSYMGYQSEEAFKNDLYINYLESEAIQKYVSDNITEDELKDYYEKDVYPNMTISHILITPEVTSDMTDDEKTKAEEDAKKQAEDIIKELKDAKKNNEDIAEKFAELAKEYSKDDSTKDKGGDLGEINLGSLNSQYDELVKAANDLKEGEYSTEVITTELGYHVILKTKVGEKESYDDALESMKEKITNDKLEKTPSLMPEAMQEFRKKYGLDIIDDELDSQYGTYMNNLINAYKAQDNQ